MKWNYTHCCLMFLALSISCAGAEITVKDELLRSAPKTILIGEMENRVLDFNPFVVKNFIDALAFEFFVRGYDVKQTPLSKNIEELVSSQSADLFITGSIFEARYGDAIEDQTSTAVQLVLHTKKNMSAGSCRIITDETLSDVRVVRRLASMCAEAIHRKVQPEK